MLINLACVDAVAVILYFSSMLLYHVISIATLYYLLFQQLNSLRWIMMYVIVCIQWSYPRRGLSGHCQGYHFY